MPVRPPSLRAIAAFEAAARHGSFTKAADELNLTQSAISHAIRSLELRLGVGLFDRFGRTVSLTDAGRGFVSRLRLSLNLIAEAFEVPARNLRSRLVVGVSSPLGEQVIADHLADFVGAHPEQEIDLRAAAGASEVASGEADVAILFGGGACTGLSHRSLGREVLFPVAAPGLPPLRRPEDLAHAALIHQPDRPWRLWLEQVGLADLPTPTTITADSAAMALALARRGVGVCLTHGRLADDDLRAGRLVRLFDAEVVLEDDYAAVWNPASPRAALVRPLVDWLGRSFSADQQALPAAA